MTSPQDKIAKLWEAMGHSISDIVNHGNTLPPDAVLADEDEHLFDPD